jgi:hypothetical protein
MFTWVISLSGLSFNAGYQQLSTADQVDGRLPALGAYKHMVINGKRLMALGATHHHRDGFNVQTGASSHGLLADHFETKGERIGDNGRQCPHLKPDDGDLGESMAAPFLQHHIEHILSNSKFMQNESL